MKNLLLYICLILVTIVYAQNRTGSITYKGVVNEKFVDSFLISP